MCVCHARRAYHPVWRVLGSSIHSFTLGRACWKNHGMSETRSEATGKDFMPPPKALTPLLSRSGEKAASHVGEFPTHGRRYDLQDVTPRLPRPC